MGTHKEHLSSLYQRINGLLGGRPDIVRLAVRSFTRKRAAAGAAGMAYYIFFSLFPLLLLLISLLGAILQGELARQRVFRYIEQAIPVSRTLIRDNIQAVLQQRSIGLVGLLGLLWSAATAFGMLSYNINLAWDEAPVRGYFRNRLLAIGMVGVLTLLLFLSIAATAAPRILSQLEIPLLGRTASTLYDSMLWEIATNLLPFLFTFLLFLALYRWVPNVKVPWTAALWGAAIATGGWEIAKLAFTRYLTSGLAQYELVYGSLTTVVLLLLWTYIGSMITLFGAHLTAAVDRAYEPERSK
ncbi:MAG: YihY/virulence factor BrkB family protein [Anaerolineales bacterium]